uniref:Uncharacterized protein n=1 Tax=Rhizophora mucronata TaxID=61149 RepID=A0A2P2N7Q0_RHIMU
MSSLFSALTTNKVVKFRRKFPK